MAAGIEPNFHNYRYGQQFSNGYMQSPFSSSHNQGNAIDFPAWQQMRFEWGQSPARKPGERMYEEWQPIPDTRTPEERELDELLDALSR